MRKVLQWLLLCVISVTLVSCVGFPIDGPQQSTAMVDENGEVTMMDTSEETSVPAPWVGIGVSADWVFGVSGWEYLGVPYYYYGAPYYTWGVFGLYGPNFVYRSAYWYNHGRWNGYRGQGNKWRGWNNRWHGGSGYHGAKYGTRGGSFRGGAVRGGRGVVRGGGTVHRGTVNRGGAVMRSGGGAVHRGGGAVMRGGGGNRGGGAVHRAPTHAPARSAPVHRSTPTKHHR